MAGRGLWPSTVDSLSRVGLSGLSQGRRLRNAVLEAKMSSVEFPYKEGSTPC